MVAPCWEIKVPRSIIVAGVPGPTIVFRDWWNAWTWMWRILSRLIREEGRADLEALLVADRPTADG